jgi:hypothetical protein
MAEGQDLDALKFVDQLSAMTDEAVCPDAED